MCGIPHPWHSFQPPSQLFQCELTRWFWTMMCGKAHLQSFIWGFQKSKEQAEVSQQAKRLRKIPARCIVCQKITWPPSFNFWAAPPEVGLHTPFAGRLVVAGNFFFKTRLTVLLHLCIFPSLTSVCIDLPVCRNNMLITGFSAFLQWSLLIRHQHISYFRRGRGEGAVHYINRPSDNAGVSSSPFKSEFWFINGCAILSCSNVSITNFKCAHYRLYAVKSSVVCISVDIIFFLYAAK